MEHRTLSTNMRPSTLPLLMVLSLFAGCLETADSEKEANSTQALRIVSIDDVSVNEDGGAATFTVRLDATSSNDVTLTVDSAEVTASAGTDYIALTALPVTIAPGRLSTNIAVPIIDDALREGSETFTVTLSSVSTNAKLGDSSGTGTIIDDETGTPNSNSAPTIRNTPPSDTKVNDTYVYQVDATDPDGDSLTYTIQNRPSWLRWNREVGRLAGSPSTANIGPNMGIVITVSDGKTESSVGPFTINVSIADDATSGASLLESHPGHYISMNRYDDQSDMIRAIKPGVVGIQRRYYWKSIEPTFGNYDFSVIQDDLDLMASQGMRLVVFIEDKTFNGELPTPQYLQANHTLRNRNGGYTSKRWSSYVVDRFSMLLTAIGHQFDDHPAFEGIAIQESSLSLSDSVLDANNYTPERYRDALIDLIKVARSSMPRSQVFWYMNFLPRNQNYLADIANVAASHSVAMGGPDILPDEHSLQEHTYPFYSDFKDKLTLFNSIQYNSYAHLHEDTSCPTKYWTMGELFSFAESELNVNYIFWNRKVVSDPANSYNWTHALTVIGANPSLNEIP